MQPIHTSTPELLADACSAPLVTFATSIRDGHSPWKRTFLHWNVCGGPMPEQAEDPGSIIALLDELGSPATVASNGPRYFGFVNGAAYPVCIAAQSLAAAWDQNGALRIMSPAAAVFEDIALAWLLELFGLPSDYAATLVPEQ